MLGLWIRLTGEQSSFYITAGAFVFLLVLLWWVFNQHKSLGQEDLVNTQIIVTDMVDGNITTTSVEVNSQAYSMHQKKLQEKVKTKDGGVNQIIKVLVADKLLQCLI